MRLGGSVMKPYNSPKEWLAQVKELGYSAAEINAALKGVDPKASTEEMVRHALRAMVMKG